jgi:hypothetical protein
MGITDENGNFRIRGLNPNVNYDLKVRESDDLKYVRPVVWEL